MSNLVVCAKNAFDYAVGSANPTLVSTLPLDHLKLTSRSRTARSTTAASQDMFFTWQGNGYYFSFVHLYRHNLEPAATWRVILYPNADWTGTPVFDSGTVAPYPAYLLGDFGADFGILPLGYSQAIFLKQPRMSTLYFTRCLALSAKITLTDTGNSSGYVEADRLFGGDYLQFSYNPASYGVVWRDNGQQGRSSGGTPRVDAAYSWRELSADFQWINDSQRKDVLDIQRFAGSALDVYVDLFPDDLTTERGRDHRMVSRLVDVQELTQAGNAPYNVWATRFKFTEI